MCTGVNWTGGGRGSRKEKQGAEGAAGLRAILKEEGGRGVGGGGGKEGLKEGRGRSSKLRRRGWSVEEGKAYRPRSEMTRKSKERKGRGGGGGDGGAAVKGVGGGGSQSLSGSHSSLGRAGEDSLNLPGEDLLMVRRYRTRGRSLGPGTGNRVT